MASQAPSPDPNAVPRHAPPRLDMARDAAGPVMRLSGRLDAEAAGQLWRATMAAATAARGQVLTIDLGNVTGCDMAGAVMLAMIGRVQQATPALRDADPAIAALVARAAATLQRAPPPSPPTRPGAQQTLRRGRDALLDSIRYVGEAAVALVHLPQRWRMLRGRDLLYHAEQAGIRSLPLVIMLGYLMGLILAFQSVIPMRRFGAEIYVANLVAVALLRELGPLLAAVILAGRTASAFAAEIGTMKVNEELDALVTMGLDPMTMLVLPRLLAVMMVMPVMTLVLDLAGLAGMVTVMQGFGFPLITIARQVQWATTVTDLMGGLFKAVCFGATIAAIGCRAGLATGIGPRAVGLAATGAVVGGIVATILLDGVFALLFYRLRL